MGTAALLGEANSGIGHASETRSNFKHFAGLTGRAGRIAPMQIDDATQLRLGAIGWREDTATPDD
ncbi:MAG: hypothetical protein IJI03_09685, partial [Rudaea sp.]|nr:hypothetical protein [Rudaea sp.]